MSAHTPAPWKFGELSGAILAGNATVCELSLSETDSIYLADGHLIAAAPELLAAATIGLSWIEDAIDDGSGRDRARADAERVRAAIKKAIGK